MLSGKLRKPVGTARRWWLAVGLAVLVLSPRVADAQQVSLSGWLTVLWGDPLVGEPLVRYHLTDDRGQTVLLRVDDAAVRALGGPEVVNGRRVTITGERIAPGAPGVSEQERAVRVRLIELVPGAAALGFAAHPARVVTGSQPWVTLLCRFADATFITPHPRSWFETLMGSTPPGMNDFWRKLSYGQMNLDGSAVSGWYNLPFPRSAYVFDRDLDGSEDADLVRLANDCTAVASPFVNFANFVGINLMFNERLDCCAWGGPLRSNSGRVFQTTWMPPWGYENQSVLGQEMGHGFGLHHSSGPYSKTYDSRWDVMSRGGICAVRHPDYGCVAVHTISYHKDFLGWIPADRKYTATLGSSRTITIDRLANPAGAGDYLMAVVPIGDSTTNFYTVEVRSFEGYDARDHPASGSWGGGIPREGVLIHHVNTARDDRLAQVVDEDFDGDPNDGGAIWTSGETFTDASNKIAIAVVQAVSGGAAFEVTITNGDGKADLVPDTLGTDPTTVLPGGVVTLFVSSLNAGEAVAAAGWEGRLYLSANTTLDSSDVLLASFGAPGALPPGESYNLAFPRRGIPDSVLPGTYYLLAELDVTNQIPESNESNNVGASAATLEVSGARPDLVAVSVTFEPAEVVPDRAPGTTITVELRNDGDAIVPGGWTLDVLLSSDTEIGNLCTAFLGGTGCDTRPVSRRWMEAIDVGETVSWSLPNINVPIVHAPGAFYVIANLDAGEQIGEQSETNNVVVSEDQLTVVSTTEARQIRIYVQPGDAVSGEPFGIQPVIEVLDTAGAGVPGVAVQPLIASEGGFLSNGFPVVSDTNGFATFEGLTILGAGRYRLLFHAEAPAPLVFSEPFDVAAARATVLDNGVPLSGLSGDLDEALYFVIVLPNGVTDLTVTTLEEGDVEGDVDLYVRHGAEPTLSEYDCRPFGGGQGGGNSEECAFSKPAPGEWHIMLFGFRRYSGVTLTAEYPEPPFEIDVTVAPPDALMGAPYSHVLVATGGTGTYEWEVTGGALPDGLELLSSGEISGIPAETGSFTVQVSVTSGAEIAEAAMTIDVTAPVLDLDAVVKHLLAVSSLLSENDLTYLDLLGNRNGRLDVGDFLAWITETGASPPPPDAKSTADSTRQQTSRSPVKSPEGRVIP